MKRFEVSMLGVILNSFKRLLFSREFLFLTTLGNSVILVFGLLIFLIEHGHNPKMASYLDALWFSVSTVTTVGYGDIIPVTDAGRVLGMFMMIVGTGFFVTFTALFSNALLGQEIRLFERKLETEDDKIQELIALLKKRG